jgi:N-acetylmuramoyl-L-alanine amidase
MKQPLTNQNLSLGNAAKTRTNDAGHLLLIAFLICTGICVAQTPLIRFVDEGGRTVAEVEARIHSGSLYLPTGVLRRTFDPDLKQQYTSLTQKLVLNLRGKQINLRIGKLSATTDEDDGTIILSQPPRIIEGKRMLPLDFFTKLLPQLYNVKVFYNSPLQTIHITEKSAHLPNFPPPSSSRKHEEFLFVLDPGHGGSDSGCRGNTGTLEKDVVLDLAKRIQRLCLQNNIHVQLTREADVERRPIERVKIAIQNQGQLFLSLHCNASFSPNAQGIHIYINNPMGELRADTVTRSSNQTSGRRAIKVLAQDDFLLQSREFAAMLQEQFAATIPSSVSLMEMPLVTLSDVYMPAILIEIGYLSNAADEARLVDAENLASMSMAISLAVQRYITAFNPEKGAVKGK